MSKYDEAVTVHGDSNKETLLEMSRELLKKLEGLNAELAVIEDRVCFDGRADEERPKADLRDIQGHLLVCHEQVDALISRIRRLSSNVGD